MDFDNPNILWHNSNHKNPIESHVNGFLNSIPDLRILEFLTGAFLGRHHQELEIGANETSGGPVKRHFYN